MSKQKQPDPQHLEEAFESICKELTEIFIQKHKDYGKGNILSIKELGIAFRESEKTERLKNLLMSGNGDSPQNEALEDNWQDIAVYAIIAVMYRRGWFQSLELNDINKKA